MPVIFEPPNFVARLGGAVRPQSAGFLGVVTQKVAIIPQIDDPRDLDAPREASEHV
jgi:hypothetical protein